MRTELSRIFEMCNGLGGMLRHAWAARLACWLWLFMAGGLATVHAHAAGAYAIGAEVTGSFYDPSRSGEGFFIEHITSEGEPALLVTWFTYVDGRQRWMIGVGPAHHDEARIPLDITVGGKFPPAFDPAQVQLQPWGELVLKFVDRDHISASWTTQYPGYTSGSVQVERLSLPDQAYETSTGGISACHTGAWYDPQQSGHGMLVEVLGHGTQRQLLVVWYVYLEGEQRWIIGQGAIDGAHATMPALITSGTGFGSAFSASDVQRQAWGTLEFTVIDSDHARWRWNSSLPGFGQGELDLTRLTRTSGKDCAPLAAGQAARFLTQSSYGPTAASVATVQSLGYAGWLDQQRQLPATLHRPEVEQTVASRGNVVAENVRAIRVDRWFWAAMNAPDQLRQRMAFALSQLFVVSDQDLGQATLEVSEFYDVLVRNALGNYRELLSEVVRSPAMAAYLTYTRNQKTDWTFNASGQLVPAFNAPDENFAREVMQLFSIGLVELRRDHTPVVGVDGMPLPTYAQDLVTQTARVMTGLSFRCTGPATVGQQTLVHDCGACSGTSCQFANTAFFSVVPRVVSGSLITAMVHPDAYLPLVCYPRFNDTGRSASSLNGWATLPPPTDRKRLLAGIEIPAAPVACHESTPGSEQPACIAYCDRQLETLLDSLFHHPNTAPFVSRQLIQRFTTSNPSPGYVDRVAATFEDDGSGVRGNLYAVARAILLDPEARAESPARDFGKLREPLLRLTALWRAFDAQPGSSGMGYNLGFPEDALRQRPLGAPSVFNFYAPDYSPPGALANAGLLAPEFQIFDEYRFVTSADLFRRLIGSGYTTTGNFTVFATPFNAAYLPPAGIDQLPRAPAELVEALNQRLLYGRMPGTMRQKLVAYLQGPGSAGDLRRQALDLIHLISISPAFAVQR